jgi:hypothetical protein
MSGDRPMDTTLQSVARRREMECRIESRALELRLRPLRKLNWWTVVLPAVISAFAGAQIIGGSSHPWVTWPVGLTVLAASLLVVIHKAVKCDAYQAEANRLRRGYDALAIKYRTIGDLDLPDAETRMIALEESLATLKESAELAVHERFRLDAQAAIESDAAQMTTKAGSL